jgi:hypothetical protein
MMKKHLVESFVRVSALFKKVPYLDSLERSEFFVHCSKEKCDVGLNDWRWSLSVVRSRQIEVSNARSYSVSYFALKLLDSSSNKFVTVIPFFDFFNHIDSTDEKVLRP